MLFKKMAELLKDHAVTTMVISMDGERMRINILPKAPEGKKDPLPLSICATPAELDEGFIDALQSYTERTATLAEQMADFQKQADEAAKEAAEQAKAKATKVPARPSAAPKPAQHVGTKTTPAKAEKPTEDLGDLF